VQFFDGEPTSGGISRGIVTVERIEPGGTGMAQIQGIELISGTVCVRLDPYDVVLESIETNNTACSAPR
jgi:hypothetical protein